MLSRTTAVQDVGASIGRAGEQSGAGRVTAHSVRAGRARVHYLTAGEGPPLVLIHGLSASSRWWSRNINALAAGRRVYALDMVGFGRSWPKHRFSLDRATEAVLAWMDAIGLKQADFCGHSMGGQLCIRLAAAHPARVDRLVLVNASGLPLGAPALRLAWRCVRSSGHTRFTFAPIVLRTTLQAGPFVLLGATRSLLRDDVGAMLAHGIAAPTLVVCAERDVLIPPAVGRALHAAIPGSRLVVIPGAGHNVMYELAPRFNGLVLDFLARTPTAQPQRLAQAGHAPYPLA